MTGAIVGIPVKPFGDAKRRLARVLGARTRRRLSEELAARTTRVAAAAGARPLVLSADDEVTEWARSQEVDVLLDEGSGLDRAAESAVAWASARGLGWIICHADLPLLAVSELRSAVEAVERGRTVLAPSSTGGTPMLGASSDRFRFAYGEGSFHRHLARSPDPLVLFGVGFALDLDEPSDLDAVLAHPRGTWVSGILEDG